jgi:hypothetical protein
MPAPKMNPLKKYVDTSHYMEYMGPGHEIDNAVIRAKNALSDANAFSDSVYNQAQDLYTSGTNGSTTAKGR